MADLGPQVALGVDGERLHLQHGPIDLIIECDGTPGARAAAREAAVECFNGLLDELVAELDLLRSRALPETAPPTGPVAQRMFEAVVPFAECDFVTPMAAVAGSVADEVGAAVAQAAPLDRWMVNNGGDIAFGLGPAQRYRAGLVVDPRRALVESTVLIDAEAGIGGIATSGRHGRSLSLGIADAVTVFAPTAAAADAAATLIANHVDVGPHPEISRREAWKVDPDSDLGDKLVTLDVGVLRIEDVQRALDNGLGFAEECVHRGLIDGAVLHLANVRATTGSDLFAAVEPTVESPASKAALS